MSLTTNQIRSLIVNNSLSGTGSEIRQILLEKKYKPPSFTSEQIYELSEQLILAGTATENNAFTKAARQLSALLSLIEVNYGKGETVLLSEVNDALATITDLTLKNDAVNAIQLLLNEVLTTKFNTRNAIRNRFAQLLP